MPLVPTNDCASMTGVPAEPPTLAPSTGLPLISMLDRMCMQHSQPAFQKVSQASRATK